MIFQTQSIFSPNLPHNIFTFFWISPFLPFLLRHNFYALFGICSSRQCKLFFHRPPSPRPPVRAAASSHDVEALDYGAQAALQDLQARGLVLIGELEPTVLQTIAGLSAEQQREVFERFAEVDLRPRAVLSTSPMSKKKKKKWQTLGQNAFFGGSAFQIPFIRMIELLLLDLFWVTRVHFFGVATLLLSEQVGLFLEKKKSVDLLYLPRFARLGIFFLKK
jgi:hypothetical protein